MRNSACQLSTRVESSVNKHAVSFIRKIYYRHSRCDVRRENDCGQIFMHSIWTRNIRCQVVVRKENSKV